LIMIFFFKSTDFPSPDTHSYSILKLFSGKSHTFLLFVFLRHAN